MKQQLVAGILAVSVAGGVGTGVAFNQFGGGKDDATLPGRAAAAPTPTPTPTPTSSADPKAKPSKGNVGGAGTSGSSSDGSTPPKATLPLVPLTSLRIIAGAVGPVSVGMSKQTAYATGYFQSDVPGPPQCDRVDDLVWKPAYRDSLDVQTADDGSVVSIGVRDVGPRTRSGLGVGSEYETVRGALGDVEPVEAGYGQTGLFVQDGDGWMGFLFDAAPGEVTDASTVRFIEVTRGVRPDLVRDGC